MPCWWYPLLSVYHTFLQVERRVVNQLALAFEQQLLTRGSAVKLVVGEGEDKEEKGESIIKLVVTDKNLSAEKVDVDRVGYGHTLTRNALL